MKGSSLLSQDTDLIIRHRGRQIPLMPWHLVAYNGNHIMLWTTQVLCLLSLSDGHPSSSPFSLMTACLPLRMTASSSSMESNHNVPAVNFCMAVVMLDRLNVLLVHR